MEKEFDKNTLSAGSKINLDDYKLKQLFIDCKEIILKDSSIEIKLDNELVRQFDSITINGINFRRDGNE